VDVVQCPKQLNAGEHFKIFSQLLSKSGGVTIRLELIDFFMLLLILAEQKHKKLQDNTEIIRAMCFQSLSRRIASMLSFDIITIQLLRIRFQNVCETHVFNLSLCNDSENANALTIPMRLKHSLARDLKEFGLFS
jgi:hypothetical protein